MRKRVISIVSAALITAFHVPLFAQPGWNQLNSGTANDLSAIHFLNVSTGYVAGAAGTVLRTTNGGASWQNVSPAGVTANLNGLYVFDAPSDRVVVVGDGGMILVTTNGGAGWSTVSSGLTDDLFSISFASQTGVCGGGSQAILKSTDAGSSWSIVQSGFFGGGFRGAFMLSPQIGYVCGENSIFQPLLGKTTDSGSNWAFVPFYLNGNEGRAYAVDFTDASIGHVAAGVWDGSGAVSLSTNGGSDWSSQLFPDVAYAIDFPVSATGMVGYAAGLSGRIIKTVNAGGAWQQQTSGTAATLRSIHFIDLNNGYVAGDGGVILKTTTGGEPTSGVGDGEGVQVFSLQQNYPNPFNPSTTIRFRTPTSGDVRLTIFDIAGREIAVLVDGWRHSGSHSATWNAAGMSTGIYFCRLDVGGFTETRKLVLAK